MPRRNKTKQKQNKKKNTVKYLKLKVRKVKYLKPKVRKKNTPPSIVHKKKIKINMRKERETDPSSAGRDRKEADVKLTTNRTNKLYV